MPARGRPKPPLVLSSEERLTLERLTNRRKTAQAMALRAQIVLACAARGGTTNQQVAARLGINPNTVGKWRNRFVADRVDGLFDEDRPGVPRTITDDQVETVVIKTLEETPRDATHWSTRSMAAATGMSQTAIVRIWKAFGLKPHLVDTFKLSTDPLFVDKVRDIVALYLNPPDRAAVICLDEKTQCQALDRTQPIFPLQPGLAERRSHDYRRHGTTDLYAALTVGTGQVITQMTDRHRSVELRKFLNLIDAEIPAHLDVHLVMDNASTHQSPTIKRWLVAHPRFHVHFTPTSSSWINLVERWFSELTTKQLRRGTHRSVAALRKTIREWAQTWNDDPRPYVWHKSADEILASLARFCERISNSGH